MSQAGEVFDRQPDAQAVVHLDARDQVQPGALPQRDHGDLSVPEVGQEPGLVAHVAQQEDRVALACLEHRGQLVRLRCPRMRVAEHDVVATRPGRGRDRLDRTREERVGDIAHDRAEQHRGCSPEGSGKRVWPVLHGARRGQDTLPGLGRDRHAERRVVEDPRHGAARHAGGERDVLHRDRPRAPAWPAGTARTPRARRLVTPSRGLFAPCRSLDRLVHAAYGRRPGE